MKLISNDTTKNKERSQDIELFKMLDDGIADMESGRELPLKEAFEKVARLREHRRIARL